MLFRKIITYIFLSIAVLAPSISFAQVDSSAGSDTVNTAATWTNMDRALLAHPQMVAKPNTLHEHYNYFNNQVFDLYIVLALILFFGALRYFNPRYFQYLQRAFRSPSFGNQQLKEQIGTAVLPNLLMNVFFALSAGVYLYYTFKLNYPQRFKEFTPSVFMSITIVGLIVLYGAKFLILRFSSWVFNIKPIVSHYLYNVFLINKVLAVVLLPFIILLAFAQYQIAYPAMILSIFLVAALFISRYIRSWPVLGGFFQYNRFHFFAYLCASEILPMAILTKLLIRGLF